MCSVRISAVKSETSCVPRSLEANAGIVPGLGHDRFLPNPSQYIIQLTSDALTPALNKPRKERQQERGRINSRLQHPTVGRIQESDITIRKPSLIFKSLESFTLSKGYHLDVVRGPSTPHDPESVTGGSLSSWQGHPSQ
jgi:hypothetical protein